MKTREFTNKKLFMLVFIALNLVFAFYQISFFIGNHDWDWVKGTSQILSFNTGLFEARYSKFILNVILYGGQILPILNTLTAFALLSLGMVMLVNYWQIKDKYAKSIIALIPCIMPYILGWMYFPINIIGNFMAIPFIIGGLMLIEKEKREYKLYGILCFLVALGVYPSVAETIIICFLIKQILNNSQSYKTIAKKFLPILLTLIIFKLLILLLGKIGVIYTQNYNLQTLSLKEIILNSFNVLEVIIKQFYITLPFFPLSLKICGLGLLILATIQISKNKQSLILWLLAILTTGLTSLLTSNISDTAFMPRINFYGTNFLYTGAIAILLSQKGIYKNLCYVLTLCLMYIAIISNIEAQKVWELGKNAELNLINRITSRIEENSNTLPLTPVIAGEYSLRQKYYNTAYDINSPYILERSFVVRHIPSGAYNFYAPSQMFYSSSQIRNLKQEIYSYLQTISNSYPHQNSIYLDDEYAIIMLTTEGIQAIQAQLPK